MEAEATASQNLEAGKSRPSKTDVRLFPKKRKIALKEKKGGGMNFYVNLSEKRPTRTFWVPDLPGVRWVSVHGKKTLFELKRRHDGELAYIKKEEVAYELNSQR